MRVFGATFAGSFLAWLVALLVALKVANWRQHSETDTGIRCAWCGEAVPMAAAINGGVGGVNRVMQEHIAACPLRPRT